MACDVGAGDDRCGLDLDSLNPPDVVTALRSFPRRYRERLTGWDDADADALVRRRPDPSSWSAIEHTGHVAHVLAHAHDQIGGVTSAERPDLAAPASDGAEAAAGRPLDDVLDDLQAAAEGLAATVAAVPAEGWTRVGLLDGQERTVLWLARQAVHEGAHHLRDVEQVVRQVRGRPDAE